MIHTPHGRCLRNRKKRLSAPRAILLEADRPTNPLDQSSYL